MRAKKQPVKTERGEIMRNLPVRACSIQCIAHPEWGTWGVMESKDGYYDIHGDRGGRILSFDEAVRFWEKIVRD